MSIPTKCTVLVVGGGPAGSYTAATLAREGIDTVVLEADHFPRYHVGESMLASIRHFLRFVDLDEKFDKYGFVQKKGAAFKLNHSQPEVYTDFVAAGGPNGYAWNVVRSEADNLIFQHAGESGAKTFDGVKVNSLEWVPLSDQTATVVPDVKEPGRPVSAQWSRKDGSSGSIDFDYVVDASGRAGIVSTKYLKNRRYNQGLKNVASWGYWEGAGHYGVGTYREGAPYFEALKDASGWVWSIPLHDNKRSVGVVMNQAVATQKKKAMEDSSSRNFYLESLNDVPGIQDLLKDAKLVTDIKSASDWSYSASTYASPYVRVAGDAGCFIDPFFSSGVHLALASGLSAATTICASLKGACEENFAAEWHTKKVAEGYTRFLLVVLSALKQIRSQDEPVLNDWDEQGFDRAFAFFRPIIQGTVDEGAKLTQDEVSKTVDFCFQAFRPAAPQQREAVLQKLESAKITNDADGKTTDIKGLEAEAALTEDELSILTSIRARQMIRSEDLMNIESFGADVIDGMKPHVERGALSLVKAEKSKEIKQPEFDMMAALVGEDKMGQVVESMPTPEPQVEIAAH